MSINKKADMYDTMNRIIWRLDKTEREGGKNAAILAALRNSTGKDLSEAEDVWPLLFENLPESFLSRSGVPTAEENAIFAALQLYAIAKQGTSQNVISDSTFRGSIGKSLSAGRNADSEAALDRRFNAMITADTFDEFIYHLRQMMKILKAKTICTVNFAKLAEDLYRYQRGQKKQVCFRWATEYYYREWTDSDNNEQEE